MATGYGIFTLIWCTACMLIGFGVTGFTIYKFDHPSLLLIRPDSYQQSLAIRISSIVSLLFYCISLICYTIAAYDWVINGDDANDYKYDLYYDSRIAMFVCYAVAYLAMFFVLIERLKQMTIYIHKEYPKLVYVILITLIISGVIAFSIFFFIHDSNKDFAEDTQTRGVALFFAFLGFFIHLSLSLMIIYLFLQRLYEHLLVQQECLILSSSTEAHIDHHQHLIMLNLIKRYTTLSILCIFSTFIMMIPVLIYFSNYNKYHKDIFFESSTWWILGCEQIINTICIMLYLPLAIRLYHKICCGMDIICDQCIVDKLKTYIIQKLQNQNLCDELH